MVIGIVTARTRNGVWKKLGLPGFVRRLVAVIVTFHLVTFAWIFFRADSIGTAFTLIGNLFDFSQFQLLVGSYGAYEMLLSLGGIAALEIVHLFERRQNFRKQLDRLPSLVRWGLYYVVAMSIILFGVINQKQAFIYFQF